jgi:hypothetical protein
MQAAGLAYSGKYEFVDTVMHWGLTHEVLPKEQALSCAQCHKALSKAPHCGVCHQGKKGIDFKALATKGIQFDALQAQGEDVKDLIDKSDYIDFKSLGYSGDPVEIGGRFRKLTLSKTHK